MKRKKRIPWLLWGPVLTILAMVIGLLAFRLYQLPPHVDPALEQNVIWAIPPQYDIALPFSSGAAFVANTDGLMLRTKSGQTLSLEVPTDDTVFPSFQYGIASIQGEHIFVNGVKADVSVPDVFFPSVARDAVIPVMQEGHYGMVNRQGLWYVPCTYDFISEMKDGYAVCSNWTPVVKTWFLSDDGAMVEAEPTSFSPSASDGLAVTSTNWQHAYYSLETGAMAFSVDCQEARPFSEGLAAVRINDCYGYIDTTGTLVIDAVYAEAGEFHEGLAMVRTVDGENCFLDTAGTIRFSIGTMRSDGVFHDGSVIVQDGRRCGIMDETGAWLLRPTRQTILWSDAGFYCAHGTMGLETYCPKTDRLASPWFSTEIYLLSDEAAIYVVGDKSGILNYVTGEIVTRPCFYWLYGSGEGLIAVQTKQGGLWGYIDYEGNWVIPPMFRRAFRFTEGLASVTKADGKSGFLANPLLYQSWSASSAERATQLQLTLPFEGDTVSTAQFAAALGQLTGGSEPEYSGSAVHPITRQEAAQFLCRAAEALGENTRCLLAFFHDDEDIAPECRSDVAYVSATGIFPLAADGYFYPEALLSTADAEAAIVQMREYLLDSFSHQHPSASDNPIYSIR